MAVRHYRQALAEAVRYGSPGLAARSGFNLVNILQGWGRYDEALALSDSLPAYIHQWEVIQYRKNPAIPQSTINKIGFTLYRWEATKVVANSRMLMTI